LSLLCQVDKVELARLYLQQTPKASKNLLVRVLGINNRCNLYCKKLIEAKDKLLAEQIKKLLSQQQYSFYGSKRTSDHFRVFENKIINHKRITRVKGLFGLVCKYRKKRFKREKALPESTLPNLVKTTSLTRPNQIWSKDFTYLNFHGLWFYLATVKDNFTKEIVSHELSNHHDEALVTLTMVKGIAKFQAPEISHSDQGSEFRAYNYQHLLLNQGVKLSMSKKGCPWQNGFQESFYSYFKLEVGDINRFSSLEELETAITKHIYFYNNYRIHSHIRTAPTLFRQQYKTTNFKNQIVVMKS
jgi:putative transposase